ncbi:MAG: hypothetical protein ACQGVK_06850 [Myxococcota bacterium]
MLARLFALTALGLLLSLPSVALADDDSDERRGPRFRYSEHLDGRYDDDDSDRRGRGRAGRFARLRDRRDAGPAIPEPGAGLAFGAGILVAASQIRSRRGQ